MVEFNQMFLLLKSLWFFGIYFAIFFQVDWQLATLFVLLASIVDLICLFIHSDQPIRFLWFEFILFLILSFLFLFFHDHKFLILLLTYLAWVTTSLVYLTHYHSLKGRFLEARRSRDVTMTLMKPSIYV